jgi:hypothetical protein
MILKKFVENINLLKIKDDGLDSAENFKKKIRTKKFFKKMHLIKLRDTGGLRDAGLNQKLDGAAKISTS